MVKLVLKKAFPSKVLAKKVNGLKKGLWLYHTRINSVIIHDLTVHHTLSLITQSFLHREG
jgi:hypothetical protein